MDPAQLLREVRQSIGTLPWNSAKGYRLTGQFTLKALGDEISYDATYVRLFSRWTVDFRQADPTLNMRYTLGPQTWAASPEITATARPDQLPFCAAYDFPMLYDDLVNILGKGGKESAIAGDGSEVYVRGRLHTGAVGTFVLTATRRFPRKVSVQTGRIAPPGWVFSVITPSGLSSLLDIAPAADHAEIWFSDIVDQGTYRFPRRTDYVSAGTVIGSFLLAEGGAVRSFEPVLEQPPPLPWSGTLSFQPGKQQHAASLYISGSELPEFRDRLAASPWREWSGTNSWIAAWTALAYWLPRFGPGPSSPATLAVLLLLLLVGFVVLARRRRRLSRRAVPRALWAGGAAAWLLILVSGIASIQLRSPSNRALFTLHSAIRYSVTGRPLHAGVARLLLSSIPKAATADTLVDQARAAQSYSLAYDLIREALEPDESREIEMGLFNFAKPAYAALQGWRSNTAVVNTLAAGVGMTGLAIGCEPYVTASLAGTDRGLNKQLEAGIHRGGPGPGVEAMDDTANLAFALERSGRGDYFNHPAFQEYVRATLEMISPLATLPLFGATNPDHARYLVPFLLKVAERVPLETGRQCISALDAYWSFGRYGNSRFGSVLPMQRSIFLTNPYVIFQHRISMPANPMPGAGVILGNGQVAVLRSGIGKDAAYLALNSARVSRYGTSRDLLTFDLYADGALLLHGPGFPGGAGVQPTKLMPTSASNTIDFEGEDQAGTSCTGPVSWLINEPVFDYVRILGDRIYDHGQVQRDIVLIRPDSSSSPYFLLVDEVQTLRPETRVRSNLHGLGDLKIGMDRNGYWTCRAFSPPSFRSADVVLSFSPIGFQGQVGSAAGKLYSAGFFNRGSKTLSLSWTGSQRFGLLLAPRRAGMPEPRPVAAPGPGNARFGVNDWISLGDIELERRAGPFSHISEYVVVRERGGDFPAVLMVSGIDFEQSGHSIRSDKPVTVSMDGLKGGLRNHRPGTRVELRSPALRPGDRFTLDGATVEVSPDRLLVLLLETAGEHRLQPSR